MPEAPLPTSRRPVVGVTCAHEVIRHGDAWQQPADFVPAAYAAAIRRAGGRAVLLPVDPADAEDPAPLLESLDGLVLTGGVDLSPASYGAERHPATHGDTPERDAFEAALALGAQARDLPFLGICRGLQVVAAAGGGSLLQHLPETLGSDLHRRVPGTLDERNAHAVELVAGSLAERAVGGSSASVRSHHHQAIDRLPDGWIVTGRATDDALVEAIERPDRTFCLAVQWHPEGDERSAVIGALVRAARTRADDRAASAGSAHTRAAVAAGSPPSRPALGRPATPTPEQEDR